MEDIKALFMYKGSGNCLEPTSKMLRILNLFFEILLGSEQKKIS